MYPQPDLKLLAARKRALLGRIDARRDECAAHLDAVLRPVSWVDGVREKWRAVSPLTKMVAVPAGIFVARKLAPRFGGLLGWAPVAFKLFRAWR